MYCSLATLKSYICISSRYLSTSDLRRLVGADPEYLPARSRPSRPSAPRWFRPLPLSGRRREQQRSPSRRCPLWISVLCIPSVEATTTPSVRIESPTRIARVSISSLAPCPSSRLPVAYAPSPSRMRAPASTCLAAAGLYHLCQPLHVLVFPLPSTLRPGRPLSRRTFSGSKPFALAACATVELADSVAAR